MNIKKSIIISRDLYDEAKAQSAKERMTLTRPDGWIARAIKEALNPMPIAYTGTTEFKRQAINYVRKLISEKGELEILDILRSK